jgi:hypothetical protein
MRGEGAGSREGYDVVVVVVSVVVGGGGGCRG